MSTQEYNTLQLEVKVE